MARSKRPSNTRKILPDLILIVTEGEKTEPLYFKKFHLSTAQVVKIVGAGRNTLSLVRDTEREITNAIADYEQDHGIKLKPSEVIVWCVFDKDSFTASEFGNAINSARAKGYHVAYSNEAFELWYLLHFHYYNTGISRDQYIVKLSTLLDKPYVKNDPNIYQDLLAKQADAIRNAKSLMSLYNPSNPNNDNPSTTVFELVEYLNQFIRGS